MMFTRSISVATLLSFCAPLALELHASTVDGKELKKELLPKAQMTTNAIAPLAPVVAPATAGTSNPAPLSPAQSLLRAPVGTGSLAERLNPPSTKAMDASASFAAATSVAPARVGQSKAMMIVGGAAFITGLIIGGDVGTVIAVAGAGVGLFGLYNYLK